MNYHPGSGYKKESCWAKLSSSYSGIIVLWSSSVRLRLFYSYTMALPSRPESVNSLSVALTEHYFNMIFQKHGISFPDDASWKEVNGFPASLNGHEQEFQNTLNMVFELADLFEDARVEKLVKKCEKLNLNSSNLRSNFRKTIDVLLDDGITWGKVVVFFSFAVSFAIYLCTNKMSHLASQVSMWAAQDLQNRIQPWIDANGGWVSNDVKPFIINEILASSK